MNSERAVDPPLDRVHNDAKVHVRAIDFSAFICKAKTAQLPGLIIAYMRAGRERHSIRLACSLFGYSSASYAPLVHACTLSTKMLMGLLWLVDSTLSMFERASKVFTTAGLVYRMVVLLVFEFPRKQGQHEPSRHGSCYGELVTSRAKLVF